MDEEVGRIERKGVERRAVTAEVDPVAHARAAEVPRSAHEVAEVDRAGRLVARRAELAAKTGRTSVPALYVGGSFVGGCNDGGLGGVMTLDRDGKRKALLADAGALG